MPPISATMALAALQEQAAAVTEAEAVLDRERAIRDNLIRDAQAAGISAKRLIKATGLSRDRLYTIGTKPMIDLDTLQPIVTPAEETA